MWYRLASFESENYLVGYEGSQAVFKERISKRSDTLATELGSYAVHNTHVFRELTQEEFDAIPNLNDNLSGYPTNIKRFWLALKDDNRFSEGQKIAIVAQSLLETGKGTSELAMKVNNFGGMMWRREFEDIASFSQYRYTSPSDNIDTFYLACKSPEAFLEAYYIFINRSFYEGWETRRTAHEYITHLKNGGYAADPSYVAKVSALFEEAAGILTFTNPEKPKEEVTTMPRIDITKVSPNQSSRGGIRIDRIVVHNTAGRFAGAVSWLCDTRSRASAHLVIGRDGTVAQLVGFSQRAWHAGNINSRSIGIELEAYAGATGMTAIQESVLVNWLKWYCHYFKIEKSGIIGHNEVMNTSCPTLIWSTPAVLKSWVAAKV